MPRRCEDFPCCGHEPGDCDGSLYGSDESIKATALAHDGCEHEAGYCWVWERKQDALADLRAEQEEADLMTTSGGDYESR